MTVFARLTLFVSSYAPLLGLFAILGSFGKGWPSFLCAAIAVASVIGLIAVWAIAGSGQDDWISLRENRSRDSDVMAYFVSYVVPFAAVSSDTRTKIALAVFVVIVASLYLRASVFYIHPLLLIAGLHVYDAVTDDGSPVVLMTRRRFLRQHSRVRVVPISQSVYREVQP